MMNFDDAEYEGYFNELKSAVDEMGLALSDQKLEMLLRYLALIAKWNKAFNLTAIRDTREMLERHIIDSLSVIPYAQGERILDVGTGAGLPGIPLAICYPEKQLTLLDSNIKKTRFITQSVIELGLKNVEVRHSRIEALGQPGHYDAIVSRAFASLRKFTDLCADYLKPSGQFLAMKGLNVDSEVEELASGFKVSEKIELRVPACEAQRYLIIIDAPA